jgi:hypothetical protein
VHFKQTDESTHERGVASAREIGGEAGPRQRQLESKWGKMLGGGADALPGVHFKQTDAQKFYEIHGGKHSQKFI